MSTIKQQQELERYYKEYAEQLCSNKYDEARQKEDYARTQVGKGLLKHLLRVFVTNTRTALNPLLDGNKKGVRPVYTSALQTYAKAYKERGEIDIFFIMLVTETLKNTINSMVTRRFTLNNIARQIATEVEEEAKVYAFLHLTKENGKYGKHVDKRVGRQFKREFMSKVYVHKSFKLLTPLGKIGAKERQALGMYLLELLIESTDHYFEIIPAGRKGLLELRPTNRFIKLIEKNEGLAIERAIQYVPTIIPPKPWEDMYTGGYYGDLAARTCFMRHHPYLKGTGALRKYIARLNELDLSEVYKAVNKIQSTAYRINKDMLKIIKTITTDKGGGRAGIPQMQPSPKLPPFPHTKEEIEASPALTEQFKKHKERMIAMIHDENARRGKALRASMIMRIANDFMQYEYIYFPMNIDFRGRIYPIPTGLNPQGDDLAKSLLEYAKPVPAHVEDDYKWLAIHGAGLAGHDKISLEDRVQWVEDNKENILASAKDPISYRWWEEQDKPLQFLAFCMEYNKALAYMSEHNGSIIGYICKIPISYDGTCSGLQHYSCLLRDSVGGATVNLIDHDKPADIYQAIADKVQEMVQDDLQNAAKKEYAEMWLSYGITRKVCKRPVMTLAYGSGQYGFTNQILEDTVRGAEHFPCGSDFKAAQYLAQKIWKAVQSTVVAATTGMEYLKKIASALSKEGYPVEWVTPLGLPIQQIYLETKTETFRLRFGGASVRYNMYVTSVKEGEETDRHKQVNGVAPNFIHSLDATHLMMTINAAELSNYTTVHDSFGTSLGEASTLRKVVREQMVALYKQNNPLEDFKEHASQILREDIKIKLPQRGGLDINEILTSKFVFH